MLNVMSSAGASILAVGYFFPLTYLLWSLRYGKIAPPNPWRATGLEWQTSSPPPTENFYRDAGGRGRGVRLPADRRTVTARSEATVSPHRIPRNRIMADVHASSVVPLAHQFDDLKQQHDADELGMWLFLSTEIMFFGGMFLAYTIYRTQDEAAFAAASHQARPASGHRKHGRSACAAA